jgi:deoxycytidine triphosphate deaminase
MPIKSDRWIRRMCEEHGMIEPFEPNQVRAGTISYGVSSYGYDIRVAPEFKVFTNVHNVLVDPKNFDPLSFVDVNQDSCIVPPNSFALARTTEYFRIPRNVLAICLGKSTYARCFAGDTRVALVDGTAPTLEEMARRADDGEMFWGYSIGHYGRIEVALLDAPRFIGRDALLEVELDNGDVVRATPDHEFLMRDGRTLTADALRVGDSLMPLYRHLVRGYEAIYQPINGHLFPTHRLADEWNVRNGVYAEVAGTHRHHKDHDRRNNAPWNLERMAASDHIRHHNAESYGEDFDPAEHGEAIREALAQLRLDPEWRANESRIQSERATTFWRSDRYSEARERLRQSQLESWTSERRRSLADRMRARYEDPANRAAQSDRQRGAWTVRNHKIAAIRSIPGDHDVYCLTVPEYGNFALDAGVFVRNCGIVVNVTPLEPTWEGYLTLEISNTTPLPAKIYANEGIAQLIFFEGDEEPEVAYADRKGKYQNQVGVTLPKL